MGEERLRGFTGIERREFGNRTANILCTHKEIRGDGEKGTGFSF